MQASIKDLKNNLSAYIKRVGQGEELIITSHNHAVARLVPLTGEIISTKTNKSDFVAEIQQLHHQLRHVKLKVSMRKTVLQRRAEERS
jgi:prevent-host-death family protein